MPLFDVLTSVTAAAFGPMFRPAVLSGSATGSSTACRALVEAWREARDPADPAAGRATITLLAGTLGGVVPAPGDLLTIESRAWRVVEVARDAAGATFELVAR